MKFSGNRETTSKEEKLDRLAEKGDIRSSIPSRMKRQAILEVDPNGPLIDDTKEEVQYVFHITIQEGKEDETPEENVTAAPPQLENGGGKPRLPISTSSTWAQKRSKNLSFSFHKSRQRLTS
ncbi:hypothetical protein EV2_009049 [Malus domestica]